MHDPGVSARRALPGLSICETYLRFRDLVDGLRGRGTAVVIITHLVFDESPSTCSPTCPAAANPPPGARKGQLDARLLT